MFRRAITKMNTLDVDLDDSAVFCKSLIQKRKAIGNDNPKNSKQLKLQFSQKTNLQNKQMETVRNSHSGEEKVRSTTSLNLNSKWDESRSSYFPTRKSLNNCPLCLKSFKTDSAYSAHMKQCAKTHKMTTQQLLEALELQKKQMQERRDLGLCSQKSSSLQKAPPKKKKEQNPEQYDLALGLALSRSLSTGEMKDVIHQDTEKSSMQTLKEYGFTTKNPVAGPSRKRNESVKNSVLRERTAEERQRIIIEKVAVVLLDENHDGELQYKNLNPDLQNGKVPQLWNRGENNEERGWYVDEIKAQVLTEKEHAGENTEPATSSQSIENEISKLNLPRKGIHKDWTKMINNRKFSDLEAKTKDGHDLYLHSLVLFARCPQILEKDCESVFRNYDLSTALIFLEFAYCGTLNGLIRTEINALFDLAVEFNYDELIMVLNCLKSNLTPEPIPNSPEIIKSETGNPETVEKEKEAAVLEDRDLFTEDDVIDLTQNSHESNIEENLSENESNAEKSYWSFIQNEKKQKNLEERKSVSPKRNDEQANVFAEEENPRLDTINQLRRNLSDDSATTDLDELKKTDNKMSSDCIILSSGSESKTQENLATPPRSPSPLKMDYEVPHFDPYENLDFFSEEQISPVGLHSQSLITGDVSMESLKSSGDVRGENEPRLDNFPEPKKTVGYCSTPVTVRQPPEINSESSQGRSRKRKTRDLTASRIIRKSLGLQQKKRHSSSSKKTNLKRKNKEKSLTEALTNSILHELSKSSVFQSSPLSSRRNMFVEMTPISGRDEFVDNVTPSPNYSNMGESLIKEQLTKYGLKKNLAKNKAKKILRYIYEELHPLYNTETGKIVKMLPGSTTKAEKKSKPKTNTKSKQTKIDPVGKTKEGKKRSSKEPEEKSDGSDLSIDRLSDYDSEESEFENLSETLTQSTPSNPLDLSSAFCEFLVSNPEFHRKILLYEPIWLEELQKKLKEAFKKHFKISDLMDFLDQKCITFRSEAQARNNQRRNEKKNFSKKKNNSR